MIYLFGAYILDTQLYELRRAGTLCQVEPQVFDVLAYLIAHRDRIVTRQELIEHVWPERFVSETTVDYRVMEARHAVGDNGRSQRLIRTIRSRGYRFIAAVQEHQPGLSGSVAQAVPQAEPQPAGQHQSPAEPGLRPLLARRGAQAGYGAVR